MSCTFNADFFLRIFFFYLYDKNIMFFFFKSVPVSLIFVENPSRSLNWRKIDLSSCTKFELLHIPQKINLYSDECFFFQILFIIKVQVTWKLCLLARYCSKNVSKKNTAHIALSRTAGVHFYLMYASFVGYSF